MILSFFKRKKSLNLFMLRSEFRGSTSDFFLRLVHCLCKKMTNSTIEQQKFKGHIILDRRLILKVDFNFEVFQKFTF